MIARYTALLFGFALLPGCGGPPQDKVGEFFVTAMHRHFNKMNTDAELRHELRESEQKAHRKNPTLPPATGVQFNTFRFDENGIVVYEFPCNGCSFVYSALDYIGHEMKCVRCGDILIEEKPAGTGDVIAWLKQHHEANAVPMFKLEGGEKLPVKATVIYIRRSWVFDPAGTVDIDVSTLPESIRSELKPEYLPAPGSRVGAGFHRLDAVFVGEQVFEYDGSSVTAVSPLKETAVRRLREIRPIFLQSGR
jgi:hypothetical protein